MEESTPALMLQTLKCNEQFNGRAAERRIPGNLFGNEAAQLAKDIGAKLVIPCHFEMFEFNTASHQKFIDECQRLMQPRCGEKWPSQNLAR